MSEASIEKEIQEKGRNATSPRARGEQSVETPDDLYTACKERWPFRWDLAASADNAKEARYISEEHDSLAEGWIFCDGWCWLNPPFGDIGPWAKKCAQEMRQGCKIVMLVPASVGSNWFRDWVHQKAQVIFLNGRPTFKGHDKPYPKDLMLCVYQPHAIPGFTVWHWRKDP